MTIDFLSLTHDNIKNITPYEPGGHIQTLRKKIKLDDIIKLASNENPLGNSDKVTKALVNMDELIPYYPDAKARELRSQLASLYQVSDERLIFGAGSEELIRLLIQAFNRQDKHILFSQYAFISYKHSSLALNANFFEIPSKDYYIDVKTIASHTTNNTSVIFLANPNNPTGTYVKQEELEWLLENIPKTTLLVLDEAYYEYAKASTHYPDALLLQDRFENLVILRTFSKAYGLAGLRVGYGIASPILIDILNRIKLPFNVSHIAQCAALHALGDQSFIEKSVALNQRGMQYLQNELEGLGLSFIPSATNFLTVNFKEKANHVNESCLKAGIMLRPLHPYGMSNFLRITIGLPEQNERLISQLKQILRSQHD